MALDGLLNPFLGEILPYFKVVAITPKDNISLL